MFSLDGFDWLVRATQRDEAMSPLRWILVRHHIGYGASRTRMHGIRHMKLRDGMYDPGSRQGFPDDGTFPRVERLMTTALRQPRSAVWSGLRAVNAAAVACPPGRRVQLELFSHSGVVVLAAPFVHDALTGFTPPNGDVRVEVHTSSPTAPVGLRCGDRFAVIMPTLEPPEDLSSRITFNPV